MRRRHFLNTILGGSALAGYQVLRASARDTAVDPQTPAASGATPRAGAHQPIIDVHMHAYPADLAFPTLTHRVTGKPATIKNAKEHLQACLAEMKRLNIVKGVVSGGAGDRLAAPAHWYDAAPGRIIAGAGVRGSEDTPLPEIGVLRSAFEKGQLRVLGEVTAMYAGLTLSDAKACRTRRHFLRQRDPLFQTDVMTTDPLLAELAEDQIGCSRARMAREAFCRG